MRIGIIGGGPGGAIAAATLARAGHEAHIFETEVFPRFHIGESLLPTNMPIYEELGISRAMMSAGRYMPKLAAFFEQAGGGDGRIARFPFAEALADDPPSIFQVERSKFDKLLLDRAIELGARLHNPCTVKSVDLPAAEAPAGTQPVIHFVQHSAIAASDVDADEDTMGQRRRAAGTRQDGAPGSLAVDFVIDASGRDTLLARQMGLMDRHGDLMRAAVFGHIGNLPLVPGAQRGDIVISKADIGWAWQIPLADDKWSVGLVLKREMVQKGGGPDAVFRNHLHHFPELAKRLDGQIPTPCRSIPNISYRVRERIGRRWALLGDAGGFADPIFSSGVLLATRAAWRIGKALDQHGSDADLTTWRDQTDHDLATFIAFIRLWYDGHFIDNLFFTSLRDESISRGITSLLAGNTTDPGNRFLDMLRKRMARDAAKAG
jgi:flavin-dependent dehydrogenase